MTVRLRITRPAPAALWAVETHSDPLRARPPRAARSELWLWTVAAVFFLSGLAALTRLGA